MNLAGLLTGFHGHLSTFPLNYYSKSRIIGAPVDMDKVGYYWLYSYALCLDYFHNGRLLGCANYPAFTVFVSGLLLVDVMHQYGYQIPATTVLVRYVNQA